MPPFVPAVNNFFFNPAEFLQAALLQAVFSFRKNGGDLCSTSLILSITFFRFPKIFSSQRVKVIMQFFMSAEEVYAPLCSNCQSLFSLSEKFLASQVKVIIQFCMSEGDLCSSFRTPSITFSGLAKLCFACVPF